MKIFKTLTYILATLILAVFATSVRSAAQAPDDNSYSYYNDGNSSSKFKSKHNNYKRDVVYNPSDSVVRVKYGNTLWSIAREYRPKGTTTKQVMLATLKLNPKAFAINNVNALLKNTNLRMPTYAQAHQITAGRADIEVARQNSEWATYQSKSSYSKTSKDLANKSTWTMPKNQTDISVQQQLVEAKRNEQALKNQIAKMEKLLKQKDLTIKRMRAGANPNAKGALFKGIEDYEVIDGEAVKSNWPWFVAGGFLLFVLFLLLRWKRKNGRYGGSGSAKKKQQKVQEKQQRKAAKLELRNAKKQAKLEARAEKARAKELAKQAKSAKKQELAKQKADKESAVVLAGFDAVKADAMKQLERDFNLPPSEDLSIDAVLDNKIAKKTLPTEQSTKSKIEEPDAFDELNDIELDFSLDDELDKEIAKKLNSRTDESISAQTNLAKTGATLTRDLDEVNVLDQNENKVVFDIEDRIDLDDLLLDEEHIKRIQQDIRHEQKKPEVVDNVEEIAADELENLIFSKVADDIADKSILESNFNELNELEELVPKDSEAEKEQLDFSELAQLDNSQLDFENISTEEDFLSDEQADKLENDLLQQNNLSCHASVASESAEETLNAKQDFEKIEKTLEERTQLSDFVDFNDLLHAVIEQPELAKSDSNTQALFSNLIKSDIDGSADKTNSNDDNIDAYAAFMSLGGFDALDDIYEFTYNNLDNSKAAPIESNDEQVKVWRKLREEEQTKNVIGGLELNSKTIAFEKFYDTPQLHRLQEILRKKEIEQFENYFAQDDEEDSIKFEKNAKKLSVADKGDNFLLDLDDFSEVPEFKEVEELDLEGLDLAIDMAEADIDDIDELEHILKEADQLEFESYFNKDTSSGKSTLAAHQIAEDPTLAEFSEFDNFTSDLLDNQNDEDCFVLDDDEQLEENYEFDDEIADLSAFEDVINFESPLLDEENGTEKASKISGIDNGNIDSEIDTNFTKLQLEDDFADKPIEFSDNDLELDTSNLDKLIAENQSVEKSPENDFYDEELDEELLNDIASFIENSKGTEKQFDDEFIAKGLYSNDNLDTANLDTKLNLAAAYIAIGDYSAATDILELVSAKGSSEQQARALELSERNELRT